MFTGLSAFPLTPVTSGGLDERGFISILSRIMSAGADSIGVLGSTGSYAYLTRVSPHFRALNRSKYRRYPLHMTRRLIV